MPTETTLSRVSFGPFEFGQSVGVALDNGQTRAGGVVTRLDDLMRLRDLVDYAIESRQCAECRETMRKHYKHASKWADIGILSHA